VSRDGVADDVRRIFGDVEEVAERLRAARARASMQPMRADEAADPLLAAARRERDRLVARGIDGLTKLARGRDGDLDDTERFGLRAIVQLEGRPALVIRDGDFAPPPHEWSRLAAHREGIRAVIARSGRIDVAGHFELDWLGTASLVAPGTLMTNRHVAEEFCARQGERWTFRPGMTSSIDFLAERGSTTSLAFEITEAIGVHDDYDLALLRVESTSSDGRALPEPLEVAATEPADVYGRDVYVVGYPAWDSRRNEPEPLQRIFADVYNVKRLQPGRATGYSTMYRALEHDCSTLGGNSGSPVVDLETHQVVALHFGGSYGVGNYAVPLWMLTDDPLLKKANVNFR
jgi:endonuclease G, mitochondrial